MWIHLTVSNEHKSGGKVPTELIMTDGCGFANRNFFEAVQRQFKWPSFPSAIQVRIQGAKVRLTSFQYLSCALADMIQQGPTPATSKT